MKSARAVAIVVSIAIALAFLCFFKIANINKKSDDDVTTKTTPIESTAPWNVNEVTREQLMEIDGIGEAIADKIINHRAKIGGFADLKQLLEVEGIGEKTFENMKNYLYLESVASVTTTTTTAQKPDATSSLTTSENYTKPPVTTTITQVVTPATTVVTTKPQEETIVLNRFKVNINTASLEEIMEGLLLNYDEAESIVRLRNDISYFSNPLEILYATDKETGKDMFTFEEYNQFKDFVIVE